MKEKTIRIEIMSGIVNDVFGLPEGYSYEVVEIDHFGNPENPETRAETKFDRD